MKALRVSEKLSLPLDAVTSTLVVYGAKGMGKTVFGATLAEELAANGLRWSWLDPLGVAWGIRHAADGVGKGVECLLLGGVHGDIPIEPTSGAVVADIVIEESCNVLIDFSRKATGEMWGVGQRIRFVNEYTRRLFQRQGDIVRGRRREPLFQILDEAARYIPQTIPAGNPDLSMCLAAWQQFVEEGRNVGLGVCLLTQRSARINKDVAELADAMVAFRTVGPNSLGAVLDWLGEHVERSRIKELSEEVRKLPLGSALVVSPGWLQVERVVPIRMRRTFDSSATPKPGERARTAKGEGAKPDLEKIRARMTETIERAKAEDPKELKRRIAELERQLGKRDVKPEKVVERVEVPVFDAKAFKDFIAAWRLGLARAQQDFEQSIDEYMKLCVSRAKEAAATAPNVFPNSAHKPRPGTPKAANGNGKSAHDFSPNMPTDDRKLGRCERALLTVLIQRQGSPTTAIQLAVLSGYSHKSSSFQNALGALRSAGLAEGRAEDIRVTAAGLKALPNIEPLPTGVELMRYWCGKLGRCERILLEVLHGAQKPFDKFVLADMSGYSVTSSSFQNALGKLRTLELINRGDAIRISEELK